MRPALPPVRHLWQRFHADQNAGPAVEFAFCGVALLAFLIGLLNLALLGLDLGALAHGVQMSGRWASLQTTSSYAASPTTITEPCLGSVATAFNNYASSVLPVLTQPGTAAANGSTTTGHLTLATSWTGTPGAAPGVYLTVTGTYVWSPFGFASFPAISIPLKITTASTVIGSSQTGVTVNGTCS